MLFTFIVIFTPEISTQTKFKAGRNELQVICKLSNPFTLNQSEYFFKGRLSGQGGFLEKQ